jgi:hypothetical protein
LGQIEASSCCTKGAQVAYILCVKRETVLTTYLHVHTTPIFLFLCERGGSGKIVFFLLSLVLIILNLSTERKKLAWLSAQLNSGQFFDSIYPCVLEAGGKDEDNRYM